MDIYLDANATTPVLPQARAAAMAVMADEFGNPSSTHTSGLRARALVETARARARQVLDVTDGELLFVSGATEGIQTAVLSALSHWRSRRDAGDDISALLLYGATEHKAVSEALCHWNRLLGLGLQVLAIPVGQDGRHDLAWLRAHAPRAALVCTMAANNETGVVSDLDGIAAALAGSPALWLVDSVQALGKLPLALARRGIDYAPFSGHKLYAPKGVGLLYVREGAPFTPLMAGGGQEGGRRSGTENMAGVAALGAVFAALGDGRTFRDDAGLQACRDRLADALREAFPGVVFNAPLALCLPTTLNFSVPGVSAKALIDLFDAAGVRVSGGSACGAAKALPSYVLEAMGLPAWRTASAVRMSFGPTADDEFIAQACSRIRACGAALRRSVAADMAANADDPAPMAARVQRFVADGACCYLVADGAGRRGVVIDPLPELVETVAERIASQGLVSITVLTTGRPNHAAAAALRARVGTPVATTANAGAGPGADADADAADSLGWPDDASAIALGEWRLSRLPTAATAQQTTTYLLHDAQGLRFAFIGDTLLPAALDMSTASTASLPALNALLAAAGPDGLLLPGRDVDGHLATTLALESATRPPLADLMRALPGTDTPARAAASATPPANDTSGELSADAVQALVEATPGVWWVDVREDCEQRVSSTPDLPATVRYRALPLSGLLDALPAFRSPAGVAAAPMADAPVVFVCRSGNRSAQAARALRRLGHAQAWSLAGGLALWPRVPAAAAAAAAAAA